MFFDDHYQRVLSGTISFNLIPVGAFGQNFEARFDNKCTVSCARIKDGVLRFPVYNRLWLSELTYQGEVLYSDPSVLVASDAPGTMWHNESLERIKCIIDDVVVALCKKDRQTRCEKVMWENESTELSEMFCFSENSEIGLMVMKTLPFQDAQMLHWDIKGYGSRNHILFLSQCQEGLAVSRLSSDEKVCSWSSLCASILNIYADNKLNLNEGESVNGVVFLIVMMRWIRSVFGVNPIDANIFLMPDESNETVGDVRSKNGCDCLIKYTHTLLTKSFQGLLKSGQASCSSCYEGLGSGNLDLQPKAAEGSANGWYTFTLAGWCP